MTSFAGVVWAACEDGAKPKQNVGAVNVLQCNNAGAAVEHAGGEDAVPEQLSEMRVFLEQGLKMVHVFLIKLQYVKGEHIWG